MSPLWVAATATAMDAAVADDGDDDWAMAAEDDVAALLPEDAAAAIVGVLVVDVVRFAASVGLPFLHSCDGGGVEGAGDAADMSRESFAVAGGDDVDGDEDDDDDFSILRTVIADAVVLCGWDYMGGFFSFTVCRCSF